MMSERDMGSMDRPDAFGAALDAIDVVAALANSILTAPSDQLVDDVQRAALLKGLGNCQDAIMKLCFVADVMQDVVVDLEFAAERLCAPQFAIGGHRRDAECGCASDMPTIDS